MGLSNEQLDSEILAQIGGAKSVAPRDIAQALVADGDDWRKLLPRIKERARLLYDAEKLLFIRKRKVVGPDGLKGIYRLASPAFGASINGETND